MGRQAAARGQSCRRNAAAVVSQESLLLREKGARGSTAHGGSGGRLVEQTAEIMSVVQDGIDLLEDVVIGAAIRGRRRRIHFGRSRGRSSRGDGGGRGKILGDEQTEVKPF